MKIVKPDFTAVDAAAAEAADNLIDIAERVRRGELTDMVIVASSKKGGADGFFMRYSNFSDAWRLLGALEYAKQSVHNGQGT